MTAPPFPDIAAWPPTRHTAPLLADFPSAFDPYAKVFAILWVVAFGYALDAWQLALIRAALEVYPEGHPRAGTLRYQAVVISLARQNGKTEIAAALGLWRLLANPRALVVGIASSADQARLVYERTSRAITANPSLARRFSALTDTRGLRRVEGGRYEIKASKSAALQGLPIDLGLVDELHVLKRALWGDLVSGTGGRPDCLVVGITTAGDADSDLLIDLYKRGEDAIREGDSARLGFFVWEAPESRIPEDDDTLGRYLAAANPALASGRTDLDALVSLVRSRPEPDALRFHLNRFLTSSRAPYLRADQWAAATRREGDGFPSVPPVFTFDATPGLGHVAVTATAKDDAGTVHSELVASLVAPNLDALIRLALALATHGPASFAMDGQRLRALADELRKRGLPVHVGTFADAQAAAALLHRLVITGGFVHAGDALLAQQIPRAVRKNVGDGFRISREGSADIDAICATALGAFVVEMTSVAPVQVF